NERLCPPDLDRPRRRRAHQDQEDIASHLVLSFSPLSRQRGPNTGSGLAEGYNILLYQAKLKRRGGLLPVKWHFPRLPAATRGQLGSAWEATGSRRRPRGLE